MVDTEDRREEEEEEEEDVALAAVTPPCAAGLTGLRFMLVPTVGGWVL